MTRIFNRQRDKEKRRYLRRDMTKAEVLLWLQLKNREMLDQRLMCPACGVFEFQMWPEGWDGRDTEGRSLASGTYFLCIHATSLTSERNIVALKRLMMVK